MESVQTQFLKSLEMVHFESKISIKMVDEF